jgi:hypothetical protein
MHFSFPVFLAVVDVVPGAGHGGLLLGRQKEDSLRRGLCPAIKQK